MNTRKQLRANEKWEEEKHYSTVTTYSTNKLTVRVPAAKYSRIPVHYVLVIQAPFSYPFSDTFSEGGPICTNHAGTVQCF